MLVAPFTGGDIEEREEARLAFAEFWNDSCNDLIEPSGGWVSDLAEALNIAGISRKPVQKKTRIRMSRREDDSVSVPPHSTVAEITFAMNVNMPSTPKRKLKAAVNWLFSPLATTTQ